MQVKKDGTFFWMSDQFHVRENYEDEAPHGGLVRGHNAWWRSLQMIKRLQRLLGATLVFGHDRDVAMKLKRKEFYE